MVTNSVILVIAIKRIRTPQRTRPKLHLLSVFIFILWVPRYLPLLSRAKTIEWRKPHEAGGTLPAMPSTDMALYIMRDVINMTFPKEPIERIYSVKL